MGKHANLTKINFDDFIELNNLRTDFNTLNEDFLPSYYGSSFTKQLFMRKRVKLIIDYSKYVGYIWYTPIDNYSAEINSMFVNENSNFNDKDKLTIYKSLINSITEYYDLYYNCNISSYNREILNVLGFTEVKGTLELEMDIDRDYTDILIDGIELSTVSSKNKSNIRCNIQNEVFQSDNRTPLTVEDVYFDELQQYYYDKGAILMTKDGKYIGYGQVIFDYGIPYVVNFGIVKEHRRKGYGKLLLNHLLKIVRENGFKIVKIKVKANNVEAINLYKSFGFNTCKETIYFELKR